MVEHEAGDRSRIGEREQRQRRGERLVRGNRDDIWVVWIEQRLAEGWPVDFEFWMRMPLVSFDNHDIDWAEARHQFVERGLGGAAQFMHQRPAPRRRHHDLAGPGLA